MFNHVKVNLISWNGALLIELSCPESDNSAKKCAPKDGIRYECEHVIAGFDAKIDDPVTQSFTTDNLYERWKTDKAGSSIL